MTLSKEAQYGILFGMYLTRAGRGSVAVAAANLKLSKPFLDQVARKLRIASMIVSIRGPGGGFELISKEITVYDILQALDIDFNLIDGETQSYMKLGQLENRALSTYAKWYGMNAYKMLDMKLTFLVDNVQKQELNLMDSVSGTGVMQ